MRVSVIIPLYNKGPHIRRSVESVLAQSCQELEVVVVDDGSTDDGPAIVEAMGDPRIRLIRQANSGPGAARNTGMRHASYEWLAFLDADDEWLPHHLESYGEMVSRFPDAVFLSCGWQTSIDGRQRLDPYSRQAKGNGAHWISFEQYLRLCIGQRRPVWTSVALIRKTAAVADGIFSTARRGEDLYAWILVLAEAGRLAWSPHVGATYFLDSVNRVSLSAPGSISGCREPVLEVRDRVSREQLRLLKKLSNRWLVGIWKRGIKENQPIGGFRRGLFWTPDDFFYCLFYSCLSLLPGRWILRFRRPTVAP